jgi:endoglucanase
MRIVIQSVLACFGVIATVSGCGVIGRNPKVYVNQVGYQPHRDKFAILENDSSIAQPWTLRDVSGKEVARGTSDVRGPDAESGESVHWIRFDVAEGTGYRLEVGTEVSQLFDVSPSIYRKLKYDALAYFYYNRSGIPIALPWAKEFQWTRPAGHLSDAKVPCVGKPCGYSLDVHGGWYDAGDYGKYVVNGGIALWTLFNLYERTKYLGTSVGDFADGKLSIPENSNGIDDLLDEARWELEFLMRMQVPKGQPLAGMVHHKIHDNSWTMLGHTPPEQGTNRGLHPPSTAATLNLVATAAQGARIFRESDPMFAALCMSVAQTAWHAALAHPAIYASPMNRNGGGPYDDDDVSDEFYWAAAELFVTTGDSEYFAHLSKSKHFLGISEATKHEHVTNWSAMTWQSTASLGTISLAVVPNAVDAEALAKMRKNVVKAADGYLQMISSSGFRVAMRKGSNGHYPWGSNSFLLNNGIIMGLAGDFTGDRRYLQGVSEVMDYLFGRNPLAFSYVSGYGEQSLQNPHHRFWAHQRCRRCPGPPPGAVAGGPNSRLPDPTGKRVSGCPVLKCYVDQAEAWGENEVAINWNAPLAWVAAYLDEQRENLPRSRAMIEDTAEHADSAREGKAPKDLSAAH